MAELWTSVHQAEMKTSKVKKYQTIAQWEKANQENRKKYEAMR